MSSAESDIGGSSMRFAVRPVRPRPRPKVGAGQASVFALDPSPGKIRRRTPGPWEPAIAGRTDSKDYARGAVSARSRRAGS